MTGPHLPILINSDSSIQYRVAIGNQFDILLETSERYTPYEKYDNIFTAHIEVVADCIPTRPRAKCKVTSRHDKTR